MKAAVTTKMSLAIAILLAVGSSACALEEETIATSQAELHKQSYGIPLGIEFDGAGLVSQVLVDVKESWTNQRGYYLDIEITGLNAGPRYHGSQLISVGNADVFDVASPLATIVAEWEDDNSPRHVNELYTVCVQVLRGFRRRLHPVGSLICQDFGPF